MSKHNTEIHRVAWDIDSYKRQIQTEPCFLCRIAAADPNLPHHIFHDDGKAIAFLNKYPSLFGHSLVAPRAHREHVTGDFSIAEYLDLQRTVYRVAEAIRIELQPERVYILSLGSQQGNRHVHWHVVPLPPGVPFDEQQVEALSSDRGYLSIPEEKQVDLATRLRRRIS